MKILGTMAKVSMLAFAVLGATAPAANAHGAVRTYIYYFTDETLQGYAGMEYVYCDHHRKLWGEQTEFFTTSPGAC